MHTKTILILTALLACAAAQGAVIVSGADALTWYDVNTISGHGSSLSGSTLNVTTSTATDGTNIAFANFTPQTLGVGYSIILSFDLTVTAVPNQDNNFRFGLFNTGGTLRTSDATGNNPPELRDDLGYKYRIASGSNTQSRYYFTNGGGSYTALTSNLGTQTQLGSDVVSSFPSNSTSSLKLELKNLNGTDIFVGAYLNGNLLDSGRTATAATFTFDEVAFSMRAFSGSAGYSISNLTISVVPEPSTVALLAGLIALGGVLWRRRLLQ